MKPRYAPIVRKQEGFQTCPHCKGDGKVLRWSPSTTPAFDPCPVCLAERIISKVNGLPPSRQPKADIVSLMRDCVSETWGAKSFREAQTLFDKFLSQPHVKDLIK